MSGSSYPQHTVNNEISKIRSEGSEAIANKRMRPHFNRLIAEKFNASQVQIEQIKLGT